MSALSAAPVLSGLLNTSSAWAQSAADKATARDLAAEGIKKFQAGDFEGARRLLDKAQALYDAPVHLIYLARAHAKLGNLVEAAETYRLLVRTNLSEDAPAVFKQAKEDAIEELAEVEPRLARLTISVSPEVEGLQVTVDGKPVNNAVLGVPRASNPGKRMVRVEAPGYRAVEKQVDLREGGEDSVQIDLAENDESAEEPVGSTEKEVQEAPAKQGFETGPFGFIVGVKGGLLVPLGGSETDVADFAGLGVYGRGEIGFRFLRHFGLKGFYGMAAVQPGQALTEEWKAKHPEEVGAVSSASMSEAGVAVLATMDPRHIGGFGELGFSFLHQYRWSQEVDLADPCKDEARYPGFAVRATGGMNVPLARFFTLTPAVDFALGQVTKSKLDLGCEDVDPDGFTTGDVELDQSLNYRIFVGIGGDFHFGDDWFR